MVEGARLESVCRGNSTVGSNPTLSASLRETLAALAASAGRASEPNREGCPAVAAACRAELPARRRPFAPAETRPASCTPSLVPPTEKRIVYLLQSDREPARRYAGVTSNLGNRLAAHNSGQNAHTAEHRPWHLLVHLEFRTEQAALDFERYLKSGAGRTFAKRHFP